MNAPCCRSACCSLSTAISRVERVHQDVDKPAAVHFLRPGQIPECLQRLDETKPGSGLGLSIIVELATLYGGSLTLGTAPLGGLRAELVLPAV